MTKLEHCKEVLALLGGKWPYPGALSVAANHHRDGKTPQQSADLIKNGPAKKTRAPRNAS